MRFHTFRGILFALSVVVLLECLFVEKLFLLAAGDSNQGYLYQSTNIPEDKKFKPKPVKKEVSKKSVKKAAPSTELKRSPEPEAIPPEVIISSMTSLEQETADLMSFVVDRYRGETSAAKESSLEEDLEQDRKVLKAAPTYLEKVKDPDRRTPYQDRLYKERVLKEGDMQYRVAISDQKVTLEEAINIALANDLQLLASKKEVVLARAKLTEARRALFPTVQGVMTINGGIVSGRFYRGESQKVNVTQPIFHGGELIFTVKEAEANWKASQKEYEKAKGEVIHGVRSAYYGLVAAEYNLQYQETLFEKIREIYQRTKKEYAQNLTSEVDYLHMESYYYEVLFQLESAKHDLLSSNILLLQALALKNNEQLAIDLRLHFVKVNPELEELLEMGLQRNPDIQIARLGVEASEYRAKVYNAKRLPKVDLRGSYGMLGEVFKDTIAIASDNHDLDTEKEWFIGVNASMPLGPNSIEYDQAKHVYGPTVLALTGSEDWKHTVTFNLLDKFSDMTDEKDAQLKLIRSEREFDDKKNGLIVDIRDSFYDVQKSSIQMDSTLAKMRYQEKQNNIYGYLLSVQEGSLEDFIEGLIDQARNKFSFIQAVTDYHLAVSELNVNVGDPYYFKSTP